MKRFASTLLMFCGIPIPLELYDISMPDESELIRRGIERITFYQADTVNGFREYDRNGRRTRESVNGMMYEFRYDETGRLIEEIERWLPRPSTLRRKLYEYDPLGRLLRTMWSRDENGTDGTPADFYRYSVDGQLTEWWRMQTDGTPQLVSITDSVEGRKSVRWMTNNFIGRETILYDANGMMRETFQYTSGGDLDRRTVVSHEPCRCTIRDTVFDRSAPTGFSWTVIDTCARRTTGESYDDYYWGRSDSLLMIRTERREEIFDERGRSLDRSVFMIVYVSGQGEDTTIEPPAANSFELIRSRRKTTYDEGGLLVAEHVMMYDNDGKERKLRYEYEFYGPEESEGATIR